MTKASNTTKQHTPGPWGLCDDRKDGVSVITSGGDDGRSIAFIELVDVSEPELEANARLIAAAPDLLAALEAMVAADEHGWPVNMGGSARDAANDAIAKARRPL